MASINEFIWEMGVQTVLDVPLRSLAGQV